MRKILTSLAIFVLCIASVSALTYVNRGYGVQGTLGQPFAGTYRPVDTWNTGLGYNRGYGRDGTLGQPFSGTYRPVDTWNTGLGSNAGFGRDGSYGRYGTGYQNYYRPARSNDYSWTGNSLNMYSGKSTFSSFGRLSYNPAPRTYNAISYRSTYY